MLKINLDPRKSYERRVRIITPSGEEIMVHLGVKYGFNFLAIDADDDIEIKTEFLTDGIWGEKGNE